MQLPQSRSPIPGPDPAPPPRVAVVALPAAPLAEGFLARVEAAVASGVSGVVLEGAPGALSYGHGLAARSAHERLARQGLRTVVVADPHGDARALDAAAYQGERATTLAAALVLVTDSGPRPADDTVTGAAPVPLPGAGRFPAARPVPAQPEPLADETLRALAELGIALRTGIVLAARAGGLGVVEFLVLADLALAPSRVGPLAERFALSEGETLDLLTRLRDLRLVETADGHHHLTAVGREVLYAPARELVTDLQAANAQLPPQARRDTVALLGRWRAAHEAHNRRLRSWLRGARPSR